MRSNHLWRTRTRAWRACILGYRSLTYRSLSYFRRLLVRRLDRDVHLRVSRPDWPLHLGLGSARSPHRYLHGIEGILTGRRIPPIVSLSVRKCCSKKLFLVWWTYRNLIPSYACASWNNDYSWSMRSIDCHCDKLYIFEYSATGWHNKSNTHLCLPWSLFFTRDGQRGRILDCTVQINK